MHNHNNICSRKLCKTCCLSEQLNLHCERCNLDLLYFSTRRCFLWRSVYWNGWSSFPNGKRPAGNLNHHEHKLLQSFIALQLHHEVKVANYRVNYFFLFLSFFPLFFSGCSFYIWHDKRTAPWSLSIRHVFSHIKLNSEYFLALRLLLAQLHNLITHKKKYCQSNKNVTS